MDKRLTILDLLEAKTAGRRIVAVSCYDYTTARLVAAAGVDVILAGDSAAQILLGHDSTLPATMDFMVAITAAVRRAAPLACLVADMPFLSYQTGVGDAVRNAGRFVQEAGAQVIKIEASNAYLDVVKGVSDAGMPVMAHIGIRPQGIIKQGRLRAEGTTADLAYELILSAEQMIAAGASALLIEGTAREVAGLITKRVSVPVISCGSGPDCDGQILILSDILGISPCARPKFSKAYVDLSGPITEAVGDYARQVRLGAFPDDEHCYHIKAGQFEKLTEMMGGGREGES